MLLAVPLFDQTNKWCLDLPNAANISFHFPTVLRVYMLVFIPGNTPFFVFNHSAGCGLKNESGLFVLLSLVSV